MERHFHDELGQLKDSLLQMGLAVESAIDKAMAILMDKNSSYAEEVFKIEGRVNSMEINIDAKGHSLLALDQPMARDLRMITSILKINTDLERISDHAVNIVERALTIIRGEPIPEGAPVFPMAEASRKMVHDVLDAFISGDIDLARSVLARDDAVDAYNDELSQQMVALMERHPQYIRTGISLITISHNLERIADLANNIAEDVIYMKQGKEVRHHIEDAGSL